MTTTCKSQWIQCHNQATHDNLCCMCFELEYLDDGDHCVHRDDEVPAPFTLLRSLWQ